GRAHYPESQDGSGYAGARGIGIGPFGFGLAVEGGIEFLFRLGSRRRGTRSSVLFNFGKEPGCRSAISDGLAVLWRGSLAVDIYRERSAEDRAQDACHRPCGVGYYLCCRLAAGCIGCGMRPGRYPVAGFRVKGVGLCPARCLIITLIV